MHPPVPSLAFLLSTVLLLSACAGSGDKRDTEEAAAAVGEVAAAAPAQAPASPRTLREVVDAFAARKASFEQVNSARVSRNAGTFDVTMTFAPSGEVVECRMLSTDFRDDPAFNAAVMAEVWRVRIEPRPGLGEFVVNRYSIAFSARNEAVAAPP